MKHLKYLMNNPHWKHSQPPTPKQLETANKIVALLEKEKIYQEPELTIKNMADKIEIPYYQVSQAINDVLNKNFYDLVNGYRVEEAKRLLLHPDNRNYTILSVGFEAGFEFQDHLQYCHLKNLQGLLDWIQEQTEIVLPSLL